MKVKRYAVFCYAAYYPGGGWTDFVNSFDVLEEAINCADAHKYENKEVINLETGEDIYIYPNNRTK